MNKQTGDTVHTFHWDWDIWIHFSLLKLVRRLSSHFPFFELEIHRYSLQYFYPLYVFVYFVGVETNESP